MKEIYISQNVNYTTSKCHFRKMLKFYSMYNIILLPHRGSFVTVKKFSEKKKKMINNMLSGDICVYYLILMIFVFVDVCVCFLFFFFFMDGGNALCTVGTVYPCVGLY